MFVGVPVVDYVRSNIISTATYWAMPQNPYKPRAEELRWFFERARTEQTPMLEEAAKSLDELPVGCYVGGHFEYGQIKGSQIKHWCGIFACAMAVEAGLSDLRWTLYGGTIKGSQVHKTWGNRGIQPGDIAVINAYSHHFIISEVSEDGTMVRTIEGNTSGQGIRIGSRHLNSIVAHYQITP